MNQKATISYIDKLESGKPPITIAFHARGNQGAVAATETLIILFAKLVEMGLKFDGTSAPIFGAAKEGEPIRIYCRLGSEKIEVFYTPTQIDVVVVFDPTISRNVLFQGMHDDTIFVINTNKEPEEIARDFKIGKKRILTVDATKIAKEELKSKRSHPNTTMLGAFAHVFPFIPLDLLKESIETKLEEKGAKVVEANMKAFDRGYAEAKEFDGRNSDVPLDAFTAPKALMWYEILANGAIPATANFEVNKTGTWRTERPIVDPEKCIHCMNCESACSDKSILVRYNAQGLKEMNGFDYDHCKGCAACANDCPVKAITMIPEAEAKK